jgi:hypothetical protein
MGHAHSHDHSHDPQTYLTEQLCTIGACGTLGIVAVLMWWQGGLDSVLVPAFHIPVMLGGATLLVLAAIRGVALWVEVGRPQEAASHAHACCGHHHDCHEHEPTAGMASATERVAAEAASVVSPAAVSLAVVAPPEAASSTGNGHHHDHSHGHDHGHQHDAAGHQHGEHQHGDGHQHGWAPWRYAVLLLPIVLYALGLPSRGENLVPMQNHLESSDFVAMAVSGNEVLPLEFNTLKTAAYMPDQRERYEGKMGKITGQFVPGPDSKSFGLVRIKMTCCRADAMTLDLIIISKKDIPPFKSGQWVEVTGQIDFRKRKGHDDYLPVIQLRDQDGVVPTDAPANPYL